MIDFDNLFDVRIKHYFHHYTHLADLLNVILFDGLPLIKDNDIHNLDVSLATVDLSHQKTILRYRDNFVLIKVHGVACLIGLEHQSYVDKSMFQRVMEYDYLNYLKQFYDYQNCQDQKIKGIMTLVFYYGERKWKAPKSYQQMMEDMPDCLKSYFNVHFYPLIEIVNLDENQFQNKDNQDLIKGLKMLYGKRGTQKSLKVSHEVACILGALTHNEEIYQMIEKEKGETDMSEYVLKISRVAKQEGKSEGIITTLMKQLTQKLGQLSNETIQQIQSSNTQQLDNLTIHIFDIENENDILKILSSHDSIVHV